MIFSKEYILLHSEKPFTVQGSRGTKLNLPAGFSSFKNTGEDLIFPNTVVCSESSFPVQNSFFFSRVKEIFERLSGLENAMAITSKSLDLTLDALLSTITALDEVESKLDFRIGKIYVQYPNEPPPWRYFADQESNWTELFNTEGVFFRTPGGKASEFESGIQPHALQYHEHYEYGAAVGEGHGGDYPLVMSAGARTTTTKIENSPGHEPVNTAEETRSTNRTYRIWKKTS